MFLEPFISKANGLTAPCLLPESNSVIVEVVPCVSAEEEEEEEESVWEVRRVSSFV